MIKPINDYITVIRVEEKMAEGGFATDLNKHHYELTHKWGDYYPGTKVLINPIKVIHKEEDIIFVKKEDVLGIYDE